MQKKLPRPTLKLECSEFSPEGKALRSILYGGALQRILQPDEYFARPHEAMKHKLHLYIPKDEIPVFWECVEEHQKAVAKRFESGFDFQKGYSDIFFGNFEALKQKAEAQLNPALVPA